MKKAIVVAVIHTVLFGSLLYAGVTLTTAILATGLVLAFAHGTPIFAILIGFTALGALTMPDRSFKDEFTSHLEKIVEVGLGEQAQVMSTIPLFILTGYLMSAAKTADRLVRFAQALM